MARRTLARLAGIAEDQWGLITRRQAEKAAGVSSATLQRLASDDALRRVAQGVYHLAGSPEPDHRDLRAAWLQLAPDVPAWQRKAEEGTVSHRSAAGLFGLGHLPADRHDFILPVRRQSRRPDVRLHQRTLQPKDWVMLAGLPVTRPSRTAADLLDDREDPESVAYVVADAIRAVSDFPATFAEAFTPHAERFGLRRGDGIGVLRWLLDLSGDPEGARWIEKARSSQISRAQGT